MVTRRDELTRKLKCLFQLSADISISLRPMINVELDMFLKEKLFFYGIAPRMFFLKEAFFGGDLSPDFSSYKKKISAKKQRTLTPPN